VSCETSRCPHGLRPSRSSPSVPTIAGLIYLDAAPFPPLLYLNEALGFASYPGPLGHANWTHLLVALAAAKGLEGAQPSITARLVPNFTADPLLPWFLACNPRRYPYWYGLPDPRTALLLPALGPGPPRRSPASHVLPRGSAPTAPTDPSDASHRPQTRQAAAAGPRDPADSHGAPNPTIYMWSAGGCLTLLNVCFFVRLTLRMRALTPPTAPRRP
jgi:hypothetical protein